MASLISTSHDINFAKLVAFSSKSLIDGSSSSQASTLSLRTGINSKRHQHSSPDIVPACRAPLHAHGNVDGQHLGALDLSILDPVYIGGTNAAAHGPIIALIHSFTFPFSLCSAEGLFSCCILAVYMGFDSTIRSCAPRYIDPEMMFMPGSHQLVLPEDTGSEGTAYIF